MIDFKEKVRKEAANILENKEELNEADLKEWFWTSTEKQERIKDAQSRAKGLELLINKLESINLRATSILNNKQYFKPKEFNYDVTAAFNDEMVVLFEKFSEAEKTMKAILSEANRQLKKYNQIGQKK